MVTSMQTFLSAVSWMQRLYFDLNVNFFAGDPFDNKSVLANAMASRRLGDKP